MDPEQVTKIFDVQVSAGNRKACCICAYHMSDLIHCTVVFAFRDDKRLIANALMIVFSILDMIPPHNLDLPQIGVLLPL